MVVGEKVYGFWRKPVCFHWRKMVWFSLPFTPPLAYSLKPLYSVCFLFPFSL